MIPLGSVLRDPYLAIPALLASKKHASSGFCFSALYPDRPMLHQKEERDWGCVPPSLLFALLSLGPFVRFLFGLLQNGASSSWIM